MNAKKIKVAEPRGPWAFALNVRGELTLSDGRYASHQEAEGWAAGVRSIEEGLSVHALRVGDLRISSVPTIDERLALAHVYFLSKYGAVLHGPLLDVTKVARWRLPQVRKIAADLRRIMDRIAAARGV